MTRFEDEERGEEVVTYRIEPAQWAAHPSQPGLPLFAADELDEAAGTLDRIALVGGRLVGDPA